MGIRFSRQEPIGKYTVDFYVEDLKIAIEADGIYGHNIKADRIRDAELKELGVFQIWHIKSHKPVEMASQLKTLFYGLET